MAASGPVGPRIYPEERSALRFAPLGRRLMLVGLFSLLGSALFVSALAVSSEIGAANASWMIGASLFLLFAAMRAWLSKIELDDRGITIQTIFWTRMWEWSEVVQFGEMRIRSGMLPITSPFLFLGPSDRHIEEIVALPLLRPVVMAFESRSASWVDILNDFEVYRRQQVRNAEGK